MPNNSFNLYMIIKQIKLGTALPLSSDMLAGGGRALALAPHPDDPEAVAVTLRKLMENCWELQWYIITSASSGVLDSFVGNEKYAKAAVREKEQRNAAENFGLPAANLHFLRLPEDLNGELADTTENKCLLHAALDNYQPQLVILPAADSNPTHRLVAEWFTEWANHQQSPVVAFYNEDPKTAVMRIDIVVPFDEALAEWKSTQCEFHQSQSARNQITRGQLFAERILAVNRLASENGNYAERFQVAYWPDVSDKK